MIIHTTLKHFKSYYSSQRELSIDKPINEAIHYKCFIATRYTIMIIHINISIIVIVKESFLSTNLKPGNANVL